MYVTLYFPQLQPKVKTVWNSQNNTIRASINQPANVCCFNLENPSVPDQRQSNFTLNPRERATEKKRVEGEGILR